jgi:hypothetical protein
VGFEAGLLDVHPIEAFLLFTEIENGLVGEGLMSERCESTEELVLGEIHLAVPELWLGIRLLAVPLVDAVAAQGCAPDHGTQPPTTASFFYL